MPSLVLFCILYHIDAIGFRRNQPLLSMRVWDLYSVRSLFLYVCHALHLEAVAAHTGSVCLDEVGAVLFAVTQHALVTRSLGLWASAARFQFGVSRRRREVC